MLQKGAQAAGGACITRSGVGGAATDTDEASSGSGGACSEHKRKEMMRGWDIVFRQLYDCDTS